MMPVQPMSIEHVCRLTEGCQAQKCLHICNISLHPDKPKQDAETHRLHRCMKRHSCLGVSKLVLRYPALCHLHPGNNKHCRALYICHWNLHHVYCRIALLFRARWDCFPAKSLAACRQAGQLGCEVAQAGGAAAASWRGRSPVHAPSWPTGRSRHLLVRQVILPQDQQLQLLYQPELHCQSQTCHQSVLSIWSWKRGTCSTKNLSQVMHSC